MTEVFFQKDLPPLILRIKDLMTHIKVIMNGPVPDWNEVYQSGTVFIINKSQSITLTD